MSIYRETLCEKCGEPYGEHDGPVTDGCQGSGGSREEFIPNIEAARESVDLPGLMLLVWRIMELMGVPVSEFPKKDRTGFAMMIRDSIVNKRLVAALFTPPGEPE